MAGNWIKVEHATAHKPEVAMLSNLLGVKRAEAFGLVVLFWTWFDQNATDGCVRMLSGSCPDDVRPLTGKSMDDIMQCAGFAVSMVSVGWLEIDEKRGEIRIPHTDRHNGNTAKNRALDANRKHVRRSTGQNKDNTGTRLDKKREEKKEGAAALSLAATLPDWLPKEPWLSFVEMRRRIRAPLTDRAVSLIVRKLDGYRQAGHDVATILDYSTSNSYRGVFEPKIIVAAIRRLD